MMPRRAWLAAAAYGACLAAACLAVAARVRLDTDPLHPRVVIASVWQEGQLVARASLANANAADPAIDDALRSPGAELVHEAIVGEGPILRYPELAFAFSLVSGHDGVVGRLEGHEAWVTPDDLMAHNAYDRGTRVLGMDVPFGTDTLVLYALLAERLHTTAERVRSEAVLRRIRVVRGTPLRKEMPWAHVDARTLTALDVRDAAHDAARYLATNIRADGHFRYMVDATSNRDLPGYDWPRHAGATYFLASAASRFHDSELATACLRAAALMRDHAVSTCRDETCIGDESRVDVGSAALALLAFVEIVRSGLDPTYGDLVSRLAHFLRSQQRSDGEFMHEYDRAAGHAIDVQYLYYSGEATLALSRAHLVTGDPKDLAAARSGLAHLVGPAWRFFGNRYYFGEEHWTCQAMADSWDRARNTEALDFCARWQAYGRKLQYRAGDAVYDVDGAIGVGPWATPRLTPVASRCEAGIATLEVLSRVEARENLADLYDQQRRALALLVREQLRPGPVAIFADPDAVFGAIPGSEVDLALRIDYSQHAGSAMLRWLDFEANSRRSPR